MPDDQINITPSTQEITARGETIYEQRYRAEFEKTLQGKYVVINVANGEAIVADTAQDAVRTGLEKYPDGFFHLMRVGHRAPFEAGGYTNKQYPAINSLQDAIGHLDDSEFKKWAELDKSYPDECQEYREPFGIWFRGQADANWQLAPGIFRSKSSSSPSYIDETSMTNHFMLRAAGFGEKCRNTFDWLCLMRHFTLPTRLLDWSENFLVALYFAVCEHKDKPGRLFILNARKLNLVVRRTYPAIEKYLPYRATHGILIPLSIETALRAEMSRSRSLEHFLSLISSFDRNYVLSYENFNEIKDSFKKNDGEMLKALVTPLAVFPNRLDSRMVLQQSVFTIHGGKAHPSQKSGSQLLPEPVQLHEFGQGIYPTEFLREVEVPAGSKHQISKQLEYMGIHEGSLFPELDHQAAYIRTKWESDVGNAASA
jgi:hypothetical protein